MNLYFMKINMVVFLFYVILSLLFVGFFYIGVSYNEIIVVF